MKKIILSLTLLLLAGFSVFSQTEDQELVKRINEMFHYSEKQNWQKVVDEYYYPKMFSGDEKEIFFEMMEQIYAATDEFKIVTDSLRINSITKSITHEKASYKLIYYYTYLTIFPEEDLSSLSEEEMEELLFTFSEDDSEADIDFEKNAIRLKVPGIYLAIKDELSPNWGFMMYEIADPESEEYFNNIFTAPVMEKIARLEN